MALLSSTHYDSPYYVPWLSLLQARDYGAHHFWQHLATVAGLPSVAVPVGRRRTVSRARPVRMAGQRGLSGSR